MRRYLPARFNDFSTFRHQRRVQSGRDCARAFFLISEIVATARCGDRHRRPLSFPPRTLILVICWGPPARGALPEHRSDIAKKVGTAAHSRCAAAVGASRKMSRRSSGNALLAPRESAAALTPSVCSTQLGDSGGREGREREKRGKGAGGVASGRNILGCAMKLRPFMDPLSDPDMAPSSASPQRRRLGVRRRRGSKISRYYSADFRFHVA